MTAMLHAFQNAGRRARALLALALVAIAMFGMLVFEQAAAEPAHASNRVCSRVAVPPTLPKWQCLGNLFTPGTDNNPAGCYTTYKVVCKG